MSLLESETVEYSQSSDERMLKELERRDGIYSFIFHELETTKEAGSSLIDKANGNKSNGFKQNQFIIYQLNEMESEAKVKEPTERDTQISTTENLTATCHSYGGDLINSSSFCTTDFWKKWHPSYAASSLNTPPAGRFPDQPKFYNCVASGRFRVRLAMPPFSHNSEPLVRHRRHVLKDTSEYHCFVSRSMGHAPDLRSLFPQDPDVHAPFAQPSCASEMNADAINCEYGLK